MIDGHTEQIYKGRSTLSILDTKSERFVFLHQTVLTQHKKNLRGRVFPGRGDWQEPHLFSGWPHFERLNSLSFALRFPGYFQIFPEQLKRENLYLGLRHIPYIFPEFSKFYFKNWDFPKFSLSFPWDSDNFSNSLSFPYFPGLWPPYNNFQKTIGKTIFHKQSIVNPPLINVLGKTLGRHNTPILNRVKLINAFSEIFMFSKVKASRLNQDIFSKTSVMFSVSNINTNFLLNFPLSKMPGINTVKP